MRPEYTNKVIDEDTVAGVDAKICGCLPWSPLPCCTYCGVGPCAGEFRFKRKEPGSNVWVGTGCPFAGCPTACASCDQCSHNNDEFTIDEQHNGKTAATAAYMTPGGVRLSAHSSRAPYCTRRCSSVLAERAWGL